MTNINNKHQNETIKVEEITSISTNQLNRKCQLWPSAFNTRAYKVIDSNELVELLKQNANNELYIRMREHYKGFVETGDEEEKTRYDKIKDKLIYLTFPVMLHPKRKTDSIRKFNDLVILDIDYKDNTILLEDVNKLKHQISDDENVYMLFLSPNGYGLKIIVVLNSPIEINNISDELRGDNIEEADRAYNIEKLKVYYSYAFNQVKNYFEAKFNIVVDKSASSILGGTYLSADETPYFNPNSSLFNLSNTDLSILFKNNNPKINKELIYYSSNYEILGEIEMYVEKYCDNRHSKTMYITLQSTYYGIPENEIVDYCYSSFGAYDHTLEEIKRTVRDFYGKPYLGNQYLIRELYLKIC